MTTKTYFGFIASDQLNQEINEITTIIQEGVDAQYYLYHESICKKISHELLDNLLTQLVAVIQDPTRKQKMHKMVNAIHVAVDTMLKAILTKRSNEQVLDSFDFMHNDCLFIDNEGIRRVGFIFSTSQATRIINSLENAKTKQSPHKDLEAVIDIIIQENLEHFVKKFSKVLHLGLIKRKAIPMAEIAINKASQVAVHKLLPQMQIDACERLTNHFDKFVITKKS